MKIYFYKKENVIVKWIRICSICIAVVCIAFAFQTDLQYPVWLLPLIHAVGIFLLGDRNVLFSAPGIITLNVVMFCRYEIVPLSIYLSKRISKYAMNTKYINEAILLMALELICILLMLGITGRKHRLKSEQNQIKHVSRLFIPQNKNIVFLLLFLVLIAIAIQFPSMIGGMGLIFSGNLKVTTREAGFSGIVDMIWRAGLAWIYLYIMSKIKDRDFSGSRHWILVIVITLIYTLFTFLMNLGISRWYSIVSFSAAIFVIGKVFPQIQKKVVIWTVVPVFIVFVILSVYKNTSYLASSSKSIWSSLVDLLDVSTLDIYLAGPGCINNGLNLYHSGRGGLLSLPLDTVRNMPIVNRFIDDSYSTVELYASMLGRGDMIIPLSIQSMIYFGAPFFGVLSIIAVLLIRKMDERYIRTDNAMAFVSGFIATWFSVVFVLNYTVCISWFYAFIISMWGLFKLTTSREQVQYPKDFA